MTEGLDTRDGREWLAPQLAAAREELMSAIAAGRGGSLAQARFSDHMDALVRRIVGAALEGIDQPIAVAALGGYGRRTLCLYSDIDLLIVVDGRIGRAEERFVKAVLHPLWDLRLTVGHQVRTLGELDEVELDNAEFALAMLDARLLTGDAQLFEQARHQSGLRDRERREALLESLLRLTDARYERFNGTIYQLEPDLKDAPGGLRDVMVARMLTMLADDPDAADQVVNVRLDAASEHLLAVRASVHLDAGRNTNTLSHEFQERAAERLGYEGALARRRVEALMADYFRHARVVAGALKRARRGAGPIGRDTTRVSLGGNLELTADGVGFADERQAAAAPEAWLELFEAALAHDAPAADGALAVIERRAPAAGPSECLPTADHRRRLLALLRPRRGLYARLSEMHACGFLDCLFPQFRAISCRVIRDFYHRYTVDEHTLLAVRSLERLLAPSSTGRRRFANLLGEIESPELLVLALLFHDVGKWKEEGHAAESVRMVQHALDRLDLPVEARQVVTFLIGEHLAMSQVAFRRDSADPAVVRRFAELVGTEERLKMLCLMTLADVDAVAPGTLTAWREELLWGLYVETYNELTLEYSDHLIAREQRAAVALLRGCPPDLDPAELTQFLEGYPQRYLALFDPGHVYRHARLARDIRPHEVHLFLEPKGETWELAIVTLDKPFLFSNICGVLSVLRHEHPAGHGDDQPRRASCWTSSSSRMATASCA